MLITCSKINYWPGRRHRNVYFWYIKTAAGNQRNIWNSLCNENASFELASLFIHSPQNFPFHIFYAPMKQSFQETFMLMHSFSQNHRAVIFDPQCLCFHSDNFSQIKPGKSGNVVKTVRFQFTALKMQAVLKRKDKGFNILPLSPENHAEIHVVTVVTQVIWQYHLLDTSFSQFVSWFSLRNRT